MLLKFNSSYASHSVSYHGKRSVRNAKNFQVRIGSSRRTTPSPVHTRIAAVLYACVPVYARLRYEKLDRSNSSRRFPICTVVRLRSRSWCSHWTPSNRPVASRRSLRCVPSCPVECELGFNPADEHDGQQSGQADVTSGSEQHETRTRTDGPGLVDPEPVQSNCEKSQSILAVIKDDSWKLVAAGPRRKRGSVFFVGNLSPDCTVGSLTEFVHRRLESVGTPVKAHQCSLHTAGNGQVSARISVDATCKLTVM